MYIKISYSLSMSYCRIRSLITHLSRLCRFAFGFLLLSTSAAYASDYGLRPGAVYVVPPAQLVKQKTASNYMQISENDFDADNRNETIVGANCAKGYCENFIFKELKNKRYRFLGKASFDQHSYEIINGIENKMGAILYFHRKNGGQGCLGRYDYSLEKGFQHSTEICRLTSRVAGLLNSHMLPDKVEEVIPRRDDPDFIDMSDIDMPAYKIIEE